jgi:photosystem I P700 chlorophyll a apoprotein A2
LYLFRATSTGILSQLGNIHDITSQYGGGDYYRLTAVLFSTHWGHLSVLALWLGGTLYHIIWTGNYEAWYSNPVCCLPISHSVWDPHHPAYGYVPSLSGSYQILLSSGIQNRCEILPLVITMQWLSLGSLLLSRINLVISSGIVDVHHNGRVCVTKSIEAWTKIYFNTIGGHRILYHLGRSISSISVQSAPNIAIVAGISCISWSGHLVHVSLPASRGLTGMSFYSIDPGLGFEKFGRSLAELSCLQDTDGHIWGSTIGAGKSLLSLCLRASKDSGSLQLTDLIHHHLAVGILLLWSSSFFSGLSRGVGHRISDLLKLHGIGPGTSSDLNNSLHFHLAFALMVAGLAVGLQISASLNSNSIPYITTEPQVYNLIMIHHYWISAGLILGSSVHYGIFMVRDHALYTGDNSLVDRLNIHKSQIISHLSWVTMFLGFHTLAIYVHNDAVVSTSRAYAEILIMPFLSQAYNYTVGSLFAYSPAIMGSGDLLAIHSYSLGAHVVILIQLKGNLDSSSTALIPDKSNLGYGYSCDGPSRGGTCDVSTYDSIYLSAFWLLNTVAWNLFYLHWKNLFGNTAIYKWQESSSYLTGWFRDYLWIKSSDLISGYDSTGCTDNSVWGWIFIAAHLVWAIGFMYLISWRGYWAELIDIIVVLHIRGTFVYSIWSPGVVTPSALSIVQARSVGLSHFSVGFILSYVGFIASSSR